MAAGVTLKFRSVMKFKKKEKKKERKKIPYLGASVWGRILEMASHEGHILFVSMMIHSPIASPIVFKPQLVCSH